jgi:hypothetical protein
MSEVSELPVITREQFAIAPVELMKQCKKRKGTLFVYLWLWHYAGRNDLAWPSVDRQAEECGMDVDDIREARKWLVANGWITRIERPGRSTIFKVRSERPDVPTPPANDPSPKRPLPQKQEGYPSPKSGGGTRSNEQEPTKERNPCIPLAQARRLKGSRRLELPEWLEPCRSHLEQWQQNRKKAHPKAPGGITDSTLKGLLYAKECGILNEYCAYASEKNWQSLGFIGHREAIDKLAKEFGKDKPANKSTAKIIYTIT